MGKPPGRAPVRAVAPRHCEHRQADPEEDPFPPKPDRQQEKNEQAQHGGSGNEGDRILFGGSERDA